MMHGFPTLVTRTRNVVNKHGAVCFRRIFRRRIGTSPTLLSSAYADFLEDRQCVAIMEGLPWMTLPSRVSSVSKNRSWMLRKTSERNDRHRSLPRKDTNIMNNPFVYPGINHMNSSAISPETNYCLRLNGHTTTASGGAGIGLILEDSDSNKAVWSARIYVSGDRSPIEAEYSAIIMGMDYVCNILNVRRLTILSGNDIIVNQIHGIFNVTKSSLEILLKTITSIQRQLLYFAVKQVPSTENVEATAQAVKALATRKSLNINEDVHWKIERKDPIQKLQRNPLKMGRWRKADIPAQSTIIDPSRLYRLQFDGGAARGHVGAGMVLYDDNGTEIWCGWHYHPEAMSNNVAEYMGLICGLRCAHSLGVSKLLVEGDSLLVVQQMTGMKQKTRERNIVLFREEACGLVKCFSDFQIRYIPRAENKRADWLANHAMNLQESDGFTRINNNGNAGGCE